MSKKKALLVVAGGRAAPDVLSLLYLQPERVVILTSEEGWKAEKAFLDIAKAIPSCVVEVIHNVNAYNFEIGKKACRAACDPYPNAEWDWTFTIGSSPKITGIAAYEVAKEKTIPCWYIDTRHEKVISLVKEDKIDKDRFFHLTIDDYMKIQERTCKEKKGPTQDYREIAEKWFNIAEKMVFSKDTPHLTSVFYKHGRNRELEEAIRYPIQLTVELESSSLILFLEKEGLLQATKDNNGAIHYWFTSINAAHFLGTGDWLEIFVWYKAQQANFTDDHKWGYEIRGQISNELDLALIYKAQLIIVECKTDFDPFNSRKGYLRDLDSTAELLGRAYVGKIFVTNQLGVGDAYNTFCQHAKERNIVVVTYEQLSNLGAILKNEAMNPTYERT